MTTAALTSPTTSWSTALMVASPGPRPLQTVYSRRCTRSSGWWKTQRTNSVSRLKTKWEWDLTLRLPCLPNLRTKWVSWWCMLPYIVFYLEDSGPIISYLIWSQVCICVLYRASCHNHHVFNILACMGDLKMEGVKSENRSGILYMQSFHMALRKVRIKYRGKPPIAFLIKSLTYNWV